MDTGKMQNNIQGNRIGAFSRLLIFGMFLIFIWFLAIALQRTNVSDNRAAGQAPNFEFISFEGQTVNLADLRGKGVVLNFWASWCSPCHAEAELLEHVWKKESDNGVVFLGLAYLDQEHASLDFINKYSITYPNAQDLRSDIARRYGIRHVPETFFISPDGTITKTVKGVLTNESQISEYLELIRPID